MISHLSDVHEVDDGKVLHLLCAAVQCLIHYHTSRVPVVAEPNDNDSVFFGHDRLVHLPAIVQVLQHVRHPGVDVCVSVCCLYGKN